MVYAVLSRRSRGLSIGVNLFPHRKVCDLDCIYCEVDNPGTSGVEPSADRLRAELESVFTDIRGGKIYQNARINDIAFSGDGEPTISPLFSEAVDIALDIQRRLAPPDLKLVLITDALSLHRPATREAVDRMMRTRGEIWAKLDAGTEEYYKIVDRGAAPFSRQLSNIKETGRRHPLVIQSLFLRVHGVPIPPSELDAYIARIEEILGAGARLARIDVYTVARPTTESYATPLSNAEVDAVADRIAAAVRGRVAVERYYSGF
jgi:wyosine [tRNA(Phe)-imidazoG37] synthetase (radical SAM superfamily)